jgi:hypothetical protein
MKCYTCQSKGEVPGDCHISCATPPNNRERIGSGGNERYQQAEERARENQSVVRCIWSGSGWFPLCFDANTVFACANYKPLEVKHE